MPSRYCYLLTTKGEGYQRHIWLNLVSLLRIFRGIDPLQLPKGLARIPSSTMNMPPAASFLLRIRMGVAMGRADKLAVSKRTTAAHLARVHLHRRRCHHFSRMKVWQDPPYQCNLPPRFQDRRLRHRKCHQCPSLTIRGSNSPSTLAIFPTQPL